MFKSFASRRGCTLVVIEHPRADVSRCHTAMKKLSPHESRHPQSLTTECLAFWTPWLTHGLKGLKVKNFGGPMDSHTDWCESPSNLRTVIASCTALGHLICHSAHFGSTSGLAQLYFESCAYTLRVAGLSRHTTARHADSCCHHHVVPVQAAHLAAWGKHTQAIVLLQHRPLSW